MHLCRECESSNRLITKTLVPNNLVFASHFDLSFTRLHNSFIHIKKALYYQSGSNYLNTNGKLLNRYSKYKCYSHVMNIYYLCNLRNRNPVVEFSVYNRGINR